VGSRLSIREGSLRSPFCDCLKTRTWRGIDAANSFPLVPFNVAHESVINLAVGCQIKVLCATPHCWCDCHV
jgi:hypothetical protein